MCDKYLEELPPSKDGESVWLSFKAWVWAINTGIRKPERKLVSAAEFDTVNSQEAVFDILDLIETLFGTKTILKD